MDVVFPHELSTLLDDRDFDFDVLSLDCFDTLIWRATHAPRDVFADLRVDGIGIHQRMVAEQRARDRARLLAGIDEVSIEAIHRELFVGGDEAVLGAGVAAELAAEARHCFAFGPTVALMRAAKARGRRIVIVSDTYLSRTQLAELIHAAAGDDVAGMIDEIFCSSEHGVSKAGGLFRPVLRKLGVRAARVLHLGDNRAADLEAPKRLGIQALHIVQFDDETRDRLRLEVMVGSIFDPTIRASRPSFQTHRPALALGQCERMSDAGALGYATLGPIFYGFANWLMAEIDALSADGATVHPVFLLRDGYLPKLVFDTISNRWRTSSVQISRFTAIASSFVDEPCIVDHVERALPSTPAEVVAMQLLFRDDEIRRLIAALPKGAGEKAAFARHVRKPQVLRTILERSRAMADGLVAHVRRETNAARGDRIVLIDLGYAGSVQNYVEPLLRRELGVEVSGRYLLLREHDRRGDDKRGMIDARNYDGRSLNAMCCNVAVIEQMSTVAMGSVVAYASDGSPLCADNVIKGRQSSVRAEIQGACVDFARGCAEGYHSRPASEAEAWPRAAAAALARLMFLPTARELEALSQFEHDVNLGTDQAVRLFDAEHAATQLKHTGPFYINGVDRMYLPAELRGQGFPLSLTLMAGWRFDLDLRKADFHDHAVRLPIIVADRGSMIDSEVEAFPTHGGYFMASIPVGPGRYAIGLKFGALFEWVQIEAASFVPASRIGECDMGAAERLTADFLFEGIEAAGGGLMHCKEPYGFILVPPPAAREPMVLNVTFRPIVARLPSISREAPVDAKAIQSA